MKLLILSVSLVLLSACGRDTNTLNVKLSNEAATFEMHHSLVYEVTQDGVKTSGTYTFARVNNDYLGDFRNGTFTFHDASGNKIMSCVSTADGDTKRVFKCDADSDLSGTYDEEAL